MGRGPGQRAGLTRADVLAAAWAVLNTRGFDGLSMRAVATRLGVAPNALYSHVAHRTELVDALLDDLLSAVPLPVGDDPVEALLDTMTRAFDVLVAHADLVPLYLTRQGSRGPNARALGEGMTVQLGRAGVTGEAAAEAVRVLIVHTLGFAALATGADDAPLTAATLRANLATGLAWLLAGIVGSTR